MTPAESHRLALKSAADYLRLTADDYEQMSKQLTNSAEQEVFSGRKSATRAAAQCAKEKAALLRGQADQIERL